jgi:hypothetical protein
MKVQFMQSGGFAGLIRHCTLDTRTMEADEAATLRRLVEEANLSAPRATRSAPPAVSRSGRDFEEYQISVDDGAEDLTVVHDQSSLPAEAKALIGYLKKCAKPGQPK